MKEETTQEEEEEEAAKQLTNDLSSSSSSSTPHPLISLLLQPLHWLTSLSGQLDPTIIAGVILVYGLSQGFSASYFRVAADYFWKDVHKIQPSQAQFYAGLYSLPWLLKPVWGLLTDVLPVAGFRRRPYLVAAGVIGVGSSAAVGMIGGLPAAAALGCLIGVNLGMAVASVTIDACIARSSMEVRELAGDLQSLCGFCTSAGALIGYSSSGFVVHHLGPQGALGLLAIPPASILVLGFFLYESRVITVPNLSSEKKVLVRVGGAVANMWRTMKCPQIWKPALFIFLSLALSVTTHEGHFYWYTDPKAGPGFSKEFVGILYSIGAIASMLGVVIYHKFLKGYPFRNLLFCSQLLYGLSGMMDLFWVLRWNLAFRIPDSFFAVLEESVLRSIQQIRWIPMMVLSTKLCPPGIEGTFFALLMCIDSLGTLFSKWGGGFLIHQLHVTRTNFTNLWLAVLIRNCLRFVTLALIFLVPNVNQSDAVVPPDILGSKSSSKSDADEESQLVPLAEKIAI